MKKGQSEHKRSRTSRLLLDLLGFVGRDALNVGGQSVQEQGAGRMIHRWVGPWSRPPLWPISAGTIIAISAEGSCVRDPQCVFFCEHDKPKTTPAPVRSANHPCLMPFFHTCSHNQSIIFPSGWRPPAAAAAVAAGHPPPLVSAAPSSSLY